MNEEDFDRACDGVHDELCPVRNGASADCVPGEECDGVVLIGEARRARAEAAHLRGELAAAVGKLGLVEDGLQVATNRIVRSEKEIDRLLERLQNAHEDRDCLHEKVTTLEKALKWAHQCFITAMDAGLLDYAPAETFENMRPICEALGHQKHALGPTATSASAPRT